MNNKDNKTRITLFDLDNTLLPLDSDYSWGQFTVSLGWHNDDYEKINYQFFLDYKNGNLNLEKYIKFSLKPIIDKGEKISNKAHKIFMEKIILPSITKDAKNLINKHFNNGDIIILTTATNEFIIKPIAEVFNIKHILCTELKKDKNNWYTGEILLSNLQENKVKNFDLWLNKNNLNWSNIETTFYSDSLNDLALLEKVNNPITTNPTKELYNLAKERNWKILYLFKNEKN